MREKIDPKLKKEWEKKLVDEGLGMDKIKSQDTSSERLGAERLVSDETLRRFAMLPNKIREDILDEVELGHQAHDSLDTISERIKMLIEKGEELIAMTRNDSDKHYNSANIEDNKIKNETNAISVSNDVVEQFEKAYGTKNKKETIN